MNFFKRAIVSIKRRPGKTVILMLLVFILGNIISGAISIQRAVENTEANLRGNLPAVATLDRDWDALEQQALVTGEWQSPDQITPEAIQQIGQLPYVATFDYSVRSWLFSSDLERATTPEIEDQGGDWNALPIEDLERFQLKGVHNPEVVDIKEGIIELVAGRTFDESEMGNRNNPTFVAIISRSLADQNNLSVGSTFTIDNTIYDTWNIEGEWIDSEVFSEDNVVARESYELKVIGIFEARVEPNTGDEQSDQQQILELENTIYVPNAVTEAAVVFSFEQNRLLMPEEWINEDETVEDNMWYDPIYVLTDPTYLVAFAEAASEILPEFWIVSDLSNTFADIASSMETMQMLASIVLWVAIVATLLILSLLITLFLRDRKHEIGIYLALGEKKMRVALQIILEVVTVSVVAITLALFSGSLLAGNISETMLRNELIAQQQGDMWGGSISISSGSGSLGWFSDGDMTMEEMLESYDLSLDATTIVMFYGVGIGVILVSTLAPIAYIMRLDPKKIMM